MIVDLPDDLKKRLKSYCANNGITIHDEVLTMICQTLESYEEAVTSEQNPQGQPQPQTPIQTTDSGQQIKDSDVEPTVRKMFGLKEKEKEKQDFTDPLNIGLF